MPPRHNISWGVGYGWGCFVHISSQIALAINGNDILDVSVGNSRTVAQPVAVLFFWVTVTQERYAMYQSIVSLKALVIAGIKLGQQAEQNRKDIRDDLLSFGTLAEQWEFVGTKLMPEMLAIPAYKGCKIVKTNRDTYQFVDKKTGERHEGARSFLRDRLSLTTLLAGSGNTSKTVRYKSEKEIMGQRDFVLKAMKLLSTADRKWVIAQLAK